MHTPRSPRGRLARRAIIASAASRRTLKVPIRLTEITVSNGSSACAPRRPATRSAQPIPAQQIAIRSPPGSAAAALHGRRHRFGVAHIGAYERDSVPELVCERLAAFRVQIGDHDPGAAGVQLAHGRLAEPRGAAGDERGAAVDSHRAGEAYLRGGGGQRQREQLVRGRCTSRSSDSPAASKSSSHTRARELGADLGAQLLAGGELDPQPEVARSAPSTGAARAGASRPTRGGGRRTRRARTRRARSRRRARG